MAGSKAGIGTAASLETKAQRRTLVTRISWFREECLEQAGEEIGGSSVAAKAIRRSRFRPTKPFEETVLGADWLNQDLGEAGKYRCLN
ncbi:hypothetical protein [Parasphingorhabdus sp.]|uniref:hypothetical protein n=1 Tax=Parasphingorhabdus sp. TaxID=2709688 RepID=UPI002F91D7FB